MYEDKDNNQNMMVWDKKRPVRLLSNEEWCCDRATD